MNASQPTDYADDMIDGIQSESEAQIRPNVKRLISPAIHECHNAVIQVTQGKEHEAINAAFAKLHQKLRKLLADIGEMPHLAGRTIDDEL